MADISTHTNPNTPPSYLNMADSTQQQQQQASVEKDADADISMFDGNNETKFKKEKNVDPSVSDSWCA